LDKIEFNNYLDPDYLSIKITQVLRGAGMQILWIKNGYYLELFTMELSRLHNLCRGGKVEV